MFSRSVSLFKLSGFEIKVDISWLILAALVTWSLASGFYLNIIGIIKAVFCWRIGATSALVYFFS